MNRRHRDGVTLRDASLHMLVEELARRLNQQHASQEPPEKWCEDCRHFRTSVDPSSIYNPCAKRHKMQFYMPQPYEAPDCAGYFLPVCPDRDERPEEPPALKPR